jgi:hypothetical protein
VRNEVKWGLQPNFEKVEKYNNVKMRFLESKDPKGFQAFNSSLLLLLLLLLLLCPMMKMKTWNCKRTDKIRDEPKFLMIGFGHVCVVISYYLAKNTSVVHAY